MHDRDVLPDLDIIYASEDGHAVTDTSDSQIL